MIKKDDSPDGLLAALEPVINGLGYEVVDITHSQVNQTYQVQCIIYKDGGVSLEDCVAVHKAVFPRIELLQETKDVNLQVSSPGITRKIKKAREFNVFLHKRIKLMCNNDWLDAEIARTDDDGVEFIIDGTSRYISFSEIKKAKLEN